MYRYSPTYSSLFTCQTLFIAIVAICSSVNIHAAEKGRIGIGLDLNNKPSIYNADDNDNDQNLNIFLQYRGEKLNIDEKSIAYKLTDSEKYRFEILGKSDNQGYEASDDKLFKGMENRDTSFDLGGRATLKTGYGLISLEATGDISGAHNGHEAELRFGPEIYRKPMSTNGEKELTINAVAGMKWQSKDVVDYYYGVKDSEATASRKSYQGKSALTPYVGLEAQMNLSEHFSIYGDAIYKDRPNEVTNSPLVSGNDVEVKAGVTYWF